MAAETIPTVDLSLFFQESDEEGKKMAMEVISQACCSMASSRLQLQHLPPKSTTNQRNLGRNFLLLETENNGLTEHEDGNCITFVFQDDAGGLEVRKDGKWIPVTPLPDTMVVNVGDVIQVLSNKKFKSATRRVVRPKGKSRYSYAFFYSLQGDKWVEPLPQFTDEIGERLKYRGFFYKDYQELRMRNKRHPPSRPEDVIHITHYAITS
ncbi:hypothetical protein SLEP1_g37128 [Rubroshorea leprosula]|uniref:Fe2OG dioxygenase domain-containing protein n=1 Tax=Rubroshorea leprosula TaxID=152421 RepID=A0AAV5KTQ1_9ROSI|nr:hypothetical protein SLEP1_g37128 [Rubroshorea leprosula]